MKTFCYKYIVLICSAFLILTSCENIEHRFEEEEEEENEAAEIFAGMNEWSSMRTYPNKKLNASALTEGFEWMQRMNSRMLLARANGTTAINSWTSLAPKNFAGRILCLGFHPTDKNIIFAGSASGGLWKTSTGGTGVAGGMNWTYVPTGFQVLGVGAIAFNPSNGNEIYVGTGEVYDNGSGGAGGANVTSAGYIRTFRGSYGVGIIKSIDGGLTWTKSLDFSYSNLKGVWDILVDPLTTTTVYAATTDGVYRSLNSGGTWTLIHSVVMANDICFKPGNSSVLYVGCGNFGSTGYGIYKSTNPNVTDSAPVFTKLTSGLPSGTISGKILLNTSPAAPSTIYASIGKEPGSSDPFGIYISTNDGATWSARMTAATIVAGSGGTGLNQGWYAHDIIIDPTDINKVYWSEMEIFSSTDGFSSNKSRLSDWSLWTTAKTAIGTTDETGVGNGNYVHADVHHLYNPYTSTPDTLFAVSDGGIFKSVDAGANWIAMNGGLQTAQIYANMAISATDPNFMIGGMQDNEGIIYSGTSNCARVGGLGDGFHAAINPATDNICYVASYYFNVKKSTNKAGSFAGISSNPGVPPGPASSSEFACFNAPFVLAPSTATSPTAVTTLYGGTVYFKKYNNSGTGWTRLNGGNPLSNTSAPILYIAVSKTDADLVYVSVAPGGTARSKIFKTVNGGTSFVDITGTLPDRYYSDIAIDPANDNRIAVTLSGFGSSHVFLSNDAGGTWTDVGTGLKDIPANTALFDPIDPTILYVGNDIGVFATNNMPTTGTPASASANWNSYSMGLEDGAMVSDMLVTPSTSKLRIGTFGRGIWQNDLLSNASFLVLPVLMKSFTAENAGAFNNLEWVITNQSGVKKYEVQYSADGLQFNKIGERLPKKSTSAEIIYNLTHPVANNGSSAYYRIKTISTDGSYEYSITVRVDQSINKGKIYCYPNPTSGRFSIHLTTNQTDVVTVNIFDQHGRVVKSNKINITGEGDYAQDISGLSNGTYHIQAAGKNIRWSGTVIKVK